MNNAEFVKHLNIIKDLIKHPHVRIILLHPPYTKTQQKIIDSISCRSKHIIGQLERKPPYRNVADEIQRLILAHKDPLISSDSLQFVVLGRQRVAETPINE